MSQAVVQQQQLDPGGRPEGARLKALDKRFSLYSYFKTLASQAAQDESAARWLQ
jgi:hypothetical protein